jgi:siroheme synthase
MGCADIGAIAARLMAAGLDGNTPALAALDVSRAGASLIRSTLARLPAELSGVDSSAPVFICIGAVAADASELHLLEQREILLAAQGMSR